MKITLTMNNTIITLENESNVELMNTLDTIMKSFSRPEPSTQTYIRDEFKKYTAPAIPTQTSNFQVNNRSSFVPCSEKQQKLLKAIPEFKGRDLNTVSKQEAGMAIERWNKSRGVHYGDHY